MADLVGRAQDDDGLVTIAYGSEGLRELQLHPKAMRLSSGELAELIKEQLRPRPRTCRSRSPRPWARRSATRTTR